MALAQWQQLQRTWTFEDLQALPDDVGWRNFEIIDGALLVSPSTGMRHEFVSERLRALLREAGLPDFETVGPIAVDLHPSYRIPDLIVVAADTARQDVNPVPVIEVLLAVEVVSAGSETTDRVTKPAQYAAFGIPTYWRVETRPHVTLTAYRLEGDGYAHAGTWGPGETAELVAPFPVSIPIDGITP
jgi:Uma2 family endonuclease